MRIFLTTLLGLTLLGGCVQRKLTVKSDPPGALVWLNDQEVGRTPFTKDFVWYGRYDVAVRKEGYQTLKTHTSVYAPWWQWPPIDLVTEMLPLTDRHEVAYTLSPATTQPSENAAVVARAKALQAKLEGSTK